MSIMNSYAQVASVAETAVRPTIHLDTEKVIGLLGLVPTVETDAAVETNGWISITFDTPEECEAVVFERDGVEYRFCREQKWVEVTPECRNGGWSWFSAMCTIVYMVKNDMCVGQTAILPKIEKVHEAKSLVHWGSVSVTNDKIKFLK